jgi:hypothetical protein
MQDRRNKVNNYLQNLQSWQLFYATVATASATLTGLLFVSLSLNRDRLKGDKGHTVIPLARRTFGDFLYVLMVGLVFLVPHQAFFGLTIALLVIGLTRGVGLVIEANRYRKMSRTQFSALSYLREFGLPLITSLGLILVAILIGFGKVEFIYLLVFVIAALLVTACWNAWLLLVEE